MLFHDICRGAVVAEFVGHKSEMTAGVTEKHTKSFTKGRNVFTVLVFEKPVFGAVSSAEGKEFAFAALAGEGIFLPFFEKELTVAFGHFSDGMFANVTETVFGKDEMVATVSIAVMFDGQGAAAICRHRTEGGLPAGVGGQGIVEIIDIDGAHVFFYPKVENPA